MRGGSSDRPGTEPSPAALPPRWAPFPVQDWDAYQRTPAWQAYAAAHRRATAPPPRRRAASWLPAVVVTLCCLLAAGAYLIADARPTPAVSPWVPVDGAAATVTLQTSSGPMPGTAEQAVLPWRQAMQATAAPFADAVATNPQARTGRLWRQVLQPARASLAPAMALLAVGAARVDLIAEHDTLSADDGTGAGSAQGEQSRVFDPGIRLAGPTIGPGNPWADSGRVIVPGARTDASYRAQLRATAAGACREIHATLEITGDGAASREQRVWRLCPGAGIVAAQRTVEGSTTGFAPATDPVPASTTDPATAPSRGVPTGEPQRVPVRGGAGPAFQTMLGAPGPAAPVATGTDAMARVGTSGQDVTVFGTADSGLVVRRRLHPGGAILAVSVVGDTILADTTERRLVAWTTDGLRRWSIPLPETLAYGAVAADEGTAVTVTVSGRLSAVDVATGAQRWSVRLPGAPTAAPVTGSGLVVVADRSDTLTAVDLATGRLRWQRDADDVGMLAVRDGQVAAATVGFLSGYDLATGRKRWTARTDAAVQTLVPVASGWLVAGAHLLQAVDQTGRQRWRRDGCAATTVTADWVACWHSRAGRVVAIDTGRVLSTVTVPAGLNGPPATLVLGGWLWLFDPATYATWRWRVEP